MNNIKQSIKIIILGLIFTAGLSFAWTAPTAVPPGNNTPAPINDSATAQNKTGGLSTGPLVVTPGITNFYGNVQVSTAKNMVTDTGYIGVGKQPASPHKLDVAGGVRATSLVYVGSSDRASVCADFSGTLSICPKNILTFTNTGGSGTLPCPAPSCSWTVPDGVFKVTVDVYGGGGGGGATGAGGSSFGGGGGGGGHSVGVFNVNPNQVLTLVTGAGGAGGVNAGNGLEGSQSNFSYFLQATGGKGGKGGPFGGAGGAGGVGIINFPDAYAANNTNNGSTGVSGTSIGGTGGNGGGPSGSKGGGAGNSSGNSSFNGAVGASGKIVITFN